MTLNNTNETFTISDENIQELTSSPKIGFIKIIDVKNKIKNQ